MIITYSSDTFFKMSQVTSDEVKWVAQIAPDGAGWICPVRGCPLNTDTRMRKRHITEHIGRLNFRNLDDYM